MFWYGFAVAAVIGIIGKLLSVLYISRGEDHLNIRTTERKQMAIRDGW